MANYIVFRVSTTPAIQANIEQTGSANSINVISNGAQYDKLTSHLTAQSTGCMLYAKLVLDLIERGALVLKSAGYRVLPINLAEVYQLEMNIRFPTTRSFERSAPLLSVCLASLYPLTADELRDCAASRYIKLTNVQSSFEQNLEQLGGLLLRRRDGTLVFFHPTFREWLFHREDPSNVKFLCDSR